MIYEIVFGIVFGLAVLAIGVFVYQYAYDLAQLSEQLDAIGSTTTFEEVEPAFWKILLYQIGAIAGVGIGVLYLLSVLL